MMRILRKFLYDLSFGWETLSKISDHFLKRCVHQ